VPTIYHRSRCEMVGTLRFAHPTQLSCAERTLVGLRGMREACKTQRTHKDSYLMDIPSSVRPLFLAAGWQSGRRMRVDGRVPELHLAHSILQEVGGLHVGRSEPSGIECARSDLEFCFCEADHKILSTWGELLRSRLVEVAEVHNRHGWLIVDEAGRCFGASQIHDAFYFEGQTFGEAVERLLLGRKVRPMLRPDQHQVELYGATFTRGHPAIFEY
jgi:hypothetical protein